MRKMLMIAERSVSPEGIEDMTRELTSVIEDFDRAVQVQTLGLVKAQGIVAKEQGIAVKEQGIVAKEQGIVVKEIGKHSLPRSGDTSSSMFHTQSKYSKTFGLDTGLHLSRPATTWHSFA
jgi:hypothetical protein